MFAYKHVYSTGHDPYMALYHFVLDLFSIDLYKDPFFKRHPMPSTAHPISISVKNSLTSCLLKTHAPSSLGKIVSNSQSYQIEIALDWEQRVWSHDNNDAFHPLYLSPLFLPYGGLEICQLLHGPS